MTSTKMNPKEMTLTTSHWVVSLVEITLGLRVLFRLFGAEASSTGFTSWLYETSDTLLEPLRNVFRPGSFSSNYVLDFAALIAMVLYMVLGLWVMHLVNDHFKGAK